MSRILSLVLIIGLIVSCSQKKEIIKKDKQNTFLKHPDNMYIVDSVLNRVDSIYVYYDSARNFLDNQDTIGANIYFEHAFNLIQKFDQDTRTLLMEWADYDSLLQKLNDDYSRIHDPYTLNLEAEELRHELSEFEEEQMGDSVAIDTMEKDQYADSITIPLDINRRVKLALQYFQTKGRKVFTIWLQRAGKYEKMIKDILREEGLPLDLTYLAMIESGFNPKARSYARASGMWQFIYATGSHYGLRADWWFDERRDPLLATRAAARHLKDLYDRFGHWYLALAGYNYSPGKLASKIRRYKTNDFWKIKGLPRQTRNYVPTYIAATLIAKEPHKYGFFVETSPPVEFDSVKISECVDLDVVAKCVNSTFEEIKALNPAVMRWCTPPGVKNFTLNIPKGTKELFKTEYAKIPDEQKRSYKRHKIRSGETISGIARRYATSISVIKKMNNLRSNRIRAGNYLIIPVAQNETYYKTFKPVVYKSSRKKSSRRKPVTNVQGHKKVTYLVKKGDTLGHIAELYNTRASKIRYWNGIAYGRHIYPNQKLNIWVPDNSSVASTELKEVEKSNIAAGNYYIVKEGDTLWDIAIKHKMSLKKLKDINNLRSNRIKPGKKLIIQN